MTIACRPEAKCEEHMCDGSGWRNVGWHLQTPCCCKAGRAHKAASMCGICNGTGKRTIDVPVYGNPSEVDQMDVDCICNPAPTDDDLPEWWDLDIPGVDYDPPFRGNSYEGL